VNPPMKNNEFRIIERRAVRFCSMFFISSSETPEIKEMYPGTIGSTQGETKESNPKTKAVRIPTFCNQNLIFLD
jgi:hypothetical protein